jgi:hypothetical protein
MARSDQLEKEEAERKQRAYDEFLKRQRKLNIIKVSVAVVATVMLVMVFAGNRFAYVFNSVGINIFHEEGGVYADCSKRENKSNPYCQKKDSSSDKQWKNLSKGGSQFSLSGK